MMIGVDFSLLYFTLRFTIFPSPYGQPCGVTSTSEHKVLCLVGFPKSARPNKQEHEDAKER